MYLTYSDLDPMNVYSDQKQSVEHSTNWQLRYHYLGMGNEAPLLLLTVYRTRRQYPQIHTIPPTVITYPCILLQYLRSLLLLKS